jgi:HlyD family secretion protein
MKNKKIIGIALVVVVLGIIGIFAISSMSSSDNNAPTKEITVKKVDAMISADGAITSENQATLHFQTGGKILSLPVKEGDKVYQGQTIASLDTYALQKNLQLAANSYQISKNSTDQTNQNNQAGVVEGQQRLALDKSTASSYNNVTEAQVVTDMVKRFVDNSKLSNDSAQLSVDLANYAVQLATLTSPLSGVVTHEDVTVAGVNVTPLTSFTVADPANVVFRAYVAENEIDYVSVGAQATVSLDGSKKKVDGTVSKIYPAKVTLASGQSVYQVDIASSGLKNTKLDQSGSVLIASNTDSDVTLVPMWTVLDGKYIWVDSNGQAVLKEVKTGRVHGSDIEILDGLATNDKVITDPKTIANKKYIVL